MNQLQEHFNKVEADRAATELRKILKPRDTVYTVLRHVSASGMQRRISTFVLAKSEHTKKMELRCIDWYVRKLTGYAPKNHTLEGVVVKGWGFDAGYEIVHALGKALWPKGTSKPHGTRNGESDKAGEYALDHRWI